MPKIVDVMFLKIPQDIKKVAIPGNMLQQEGIPYFGVKDVPYIVFKTFSEDNRFFYQDIVAVNMIVEKREYKEDVYYVFERDEVAPAEKIERKRITRDNKRGYRVFEAKLQEATVAKWKLSEGEPEAFIVTIDDLIVDITGENIITKIILKDSSLLDPLDRAVLLMKKPYGEIVLETPVTIERINFTWKDGSPKKEVLSVEKKQIEI